MEVKKIFYNYGGQIIAALVTAGSLAYFIHGARLEAGYQERLFGKQGHAVNKDGNIDYHDALRRMGYTDRHLAKMKGQPIVTLTKLEMAVRSYEAERNNIQEH